MKILMQNGANPSIKNNKGMTVWDIAKSLPKAGTVGKIVALYLISHPIVLVCSSQRS